MVYVVLGVYIICWIFLYILNVLIFFYFVVKIFDELLLIVILLIFFNFVCNFIMYVLIIS